MNAPTGKKARYKAVNRETTQVSSDESSEALYYVVVNKSEVDQVLDFLEELRGKASRDSSSNSDSMVNRPRNSREKQRPLSVSGSDDPFYEWDESVFGFVVMALVHRILKDTPLEACDDVKGIIETLTERLMAEIDISDIVVKPTGSDVIPMVKAVHKKLCKISGGKRVLGILLLTGDSLLYDQIIAILKRCLRKDAAHLWRQTPLVIGSPPPQQAFTSEVIH